MTAAPTSKRSAGRACAAAGVVVALLAAPAAAAAPDRPAGDGPPEARRQELVAVALAAADDLWRRIGDQEPEPALGCRSLVSSALTLCEARRHPERLARLFRLAAAMQDRDPASRSFGNFRWYWRDAGVTDANAVEFCGFDLQLIRRLHRDWLPEPDRDALDGLLAHAVEGCLRHRVSPSYTNIAILNAANLITLGESLGRSDAADEGYRRLDALAADVWRHGLHEYCSPTYYAIDIEGLGVIERFADRDAGRALARALLELIWTDVAVNFFPAAERLAGTHSRTYDYLRGLGILQQDLRWQGWSDVPPGRGTEALHVALGRWSPPAALLELARTRFPRLVRQAWGPRPVESRTHFLLADVTLGTSAATYGQHDNPLTFDFPGRPGAVRGYFLPDGREDPYGTKKYGTGLAKHPKALHLEPFWTAAQREADALGLVVYRDADLQAEEVTNLQSQIVMPRDLDGIWLRGTRLRLSDGKNGPPARIPVAAGDPLVLRRGSAAVGLRIVWARARDGRPAGAALVDDGAKLGAIRLTIDHRRAPPTAPAAAAYWVRVGGGLVSDEAFTGWREAFERSGPTAVEVAEDHIHLAVPGGTGPVVVTVELPFSAAGRVTLDPVPSRAVLELDGTDIGRRILDQVEPCASFAAAAAPERRVALPGAGGVRIEAESGLVLPMMTVGDDGRGTRYVWQAEGPVTASGSVSWRLEVPRAGRYWLWGRGLAPDGEHDSFTVAVGTTGDRELVAGPWHLPRSEDWRWSRVAIAGGREPAALELPAGEVRLTITPRETGTRLDAIWLTTDPRARPDG